MNSSKTTAMTRVLLLGALATAALAPVLRAQDPAMGGKESPPLVVQAPLAPRPVAPADKPLPINLPTALQLADANAWDIAIAAERERLAAAVLQQAEVLWLPTVFAEVDYTHHDGPIQNNDGSTTISTRSSLMVGGAPLAFFGVTDAIFEPLAARRVLRATQAQSQAVAHDTLLAVAEAYFNVQQARGDLASAEDVYKRTIKLVERIESMAPELVPTVEVARSRADMRRIEQTVVTARERWRVASAELVRILRLDATSMVDPMEPPHLQVTLIPPEQSADDLVPIAMSFRPELEAYRELTDAALMKWREEKTRPFLPVILARGASNTPPYPMMFGAFGAGSGGSLGSFALRADYDVEAIWELKNLGFGNLALINQRRSEHEITRMQYYKWQDVVARDVAEAVAQSQSAAARVKQAEFELKQAVTSAQQNFDGLGQVKRLQTNIIILVIRPQEAVSAVQALQGAYSDYYRSVADFNRAQFRLYRALGNPAQMLTEENRVYQPAGARQDCENCAPPAHRPRLFFADH
jgi:hypothetical protein